MSAQPQEQTKYCPRCRRLLPTAAYVMDRYRGDGFHQYCRDCMREFERKRSASDSRSRRFEILMQRWDIDRLTARIEAANAADLANGGGIFTTRGEG